MTANKRLRIAALAVTLTVGASLTACGGEAESSGVTEIRYSARLTGVGDDADAAIVEAFNKKFEGRYRVTRTAIDDETYKTKQITQLTGGDAPDVFYAWAGGRAKDVIDAGFAAPLDGYYEQYGWTKRLNALGQTQATFDGKKYFAPTMMSSSAIWYQPGIFAQKGVTVPKTMPELEAAAARLKAGGVAPFILSNKEKWEAQFYWTQLVVAENGPAVYNDLVAGKGRWTDAPFVAAWQKLADWNAAGYYYGSPNSIGYADSTIPWVKGEGAMNVQGNWYPSTIAGSDKAAADKMDYFVFPAAVGKQSTLEIYAENTLMINAKSDQRRRDAAAAFVDYYVAAEAQTTLGKAGRLFPANVEVDLTTLDLSKVMLKLADAMKSQTSDSFLHVDLAFTAEVANEFLDATQGVVNKTVTPAEAAKRVQAVADRQ
ncbi:extracellular solute-binding protein [Micromonospora sp. WMMD714]|uniref:ABC transporter substrate-binding protein n=1 Tax=Micromonospora sp. WMMD714 TaxID=3016097 RepID=UPI00249A7F76|nr:extracellular solute-binding protein [Micromonospora sp. WMMD714]WFE64135.1 extracellular solute-binding protein [Micromonospora sp. WMMD714]